MERPIYPIPDFVSEALAQSNLMSAYSARPAYQRNDYVGWINRAVREDTRQKRLTQMLDELRSQDAYMGMLYNAAKPLKAQLNSKVTKVLNKKTYRFGATIREA